METLLIVLIVTLSVCTLFQYVYVIIESYVSIEDLGVKSKQDLLLWFIPIYMPVKMFICNIKSYLNEINNQLNELE